MKSGGSVQSVICFSGLVKKMTMLQLCAILSGLLVASAQGASPSLLWAQNKSHLYLTVDVECHSVTAIFGIDTLAITCDDAEVTTGHSTEKTIYFLTHDCLPDGADAAR